MRILVIGAALFVTSCASAPERPGAHVCTEIPGGLAECRLVQAPQ